MSALPPHTSPSSSPASSQRRAWPPWELAAFIVALMPLVGSVVSGLGPQLVNLVVSVPESTVSNLVWRTLVGLSVGLIAANQNAVTMAIQNVADAFKLILQVWLIIAVQGVLILTLIVVVVLIGVADQLSLVNLLAGVMAIHALTDSGLMGPWIWNLVVELAIVIGPWILGIFAGVACRVMLRRDDGPTTRDLDAVRAALARSTWPVILAALYSLVALFGLLVVYDVVSAIFTQQPQRVPSAVTLGPILAIIAFNEMQLSLIEFVTRHRNPRDDRTLWLIALPLGRALRTALMLGLMLPLVLVKLLTYFVFLMFVNPIAAIIGRVGGSRAPLRVGRALLAVSFMLAIASVVAAVIFAAIYAQLPPPNLAPPPVWLAPSLVSSLVVLGLAVCLLALDIDRADEFTERPEQGLSWLFNHLYVAKIEPGGGVFSVLFNANLMLWNLNH